MIKPKISPTFLALLLSAALFAQGELSLSRRVVDNAALLTASELYELDKLLAEHEAATSNQIVVVTVKNLGGKNIEEFSYELGRHWGIGTKEKNNGVLLIIAPQEREVRIEVGYGLEGILTDAKAKIIIERSILPYFRRGEMSAGIIQGVHNIIATLGKENKADNNNPDRVSSWSYILFIIALIILFFVRAGRGRGPRPPRSGPFFDFGSGRSSKGGFSGRGGSFGGGGASGKW